MSMVTSPTSLIWGVTDSMTPVSRYSILVEMTGFSPDVYSYSELATGTSVDISISASRLLEARMVGEDKILTLFLEARADRAELHRSISPMLYLKPPAPADALSRLVLGFP